MRRSRASDLHAHVLNVMVKLRETLGMRQIDFADAMGIERTAYAKKEKGVTPFSLVDIDRVSKKFNIGLSDFFKGYEGFFPDLPPNAGLSRAASDRWPCLTQVVSAANAAATGDQKDGNFLVQCLNYAADKVDTKR